MNERMNITEIFDGIRYPGYLHTQESLKAACSFQFQDTDILLVTFPKSGERQAGTRSVDNRPGLPSTRSTSVPFLAL